MALFDQLYNRLFKNQSDAAPFIYEPLTRSQKFLENYQKWVSSGQSDALIKSIENSYELKKNDLIGSPDVHILKGSSANGIAISYEPGMNRKELSFLKEYLKEKTLELGYKQANADLIIKEKGNGSETTKNIT